MKAFPMFALVASAALVWPLPASSAGDELALHAGHSIVVAAQSLVRVAVGDSKIAGVVPIGNSEVLINAKAVGHTTVLVWTKTGFRSYEVDVSAEDIESLTSALGASLADRHLSVTSFNDTIVVKGKVPDSAALAAVNDTLSRFAPTIAADKYNLVNTVVVERPLGTLEASVASVSGVSNMKIERDDKGNLIVSGDVPNRTAASQVLERVRSQSNGYLSTDGKIIDRLAVKSNSQVSVKMYVLEVDNTGLQNLGINLQSANFTPGSNGSPTTYTLGSPQFTALENLPGVGQSLVVGGFARVTALAPTLNLILQSGHARVLSQPNLVTLPGHQADFLVGGEVPIPVPGQTGTQVSIIYKEYGVKLKVTPTVLGNGAVQTEIAPEVSSLDFSDAIQISGFTIPAFKTSRLNTTVVTNPGESVILGGLMSRSETKNINKIPLLGDLPILGALFRSTQYQTGQSDVIFVMTPEILEH